MNTGALQQGAGSLADLPGILSKEDQSKAFRTAKRHTFAARALKYLMPLASLGIIGLYFVPSGSRISLPDLPVSVKSINLSSEGLKMVNPRYAGGSEKLGRYKIEAEYALQSITATHLLKLHKISGEIIQPNNKWTKLEATQGLYNTNTEQMELKGGIVISSNQGMEARMQTADIDMKKQIITTDKPVQMKMNENVINAQAMVLDTAKKHVLFSGGVKVKLFKNKPIMK